MALYLLTKEVDRLAELPAEVEIVQGAKASPFDFGELVRLRGFIKSWKPDIVKGFLFDANFYSRLAALGLGVPVLNGERNDAYSLNRNQRLAHYPTRFLADGVIANTHAGRAFAQALFGLPPHRTHVVWNGVDLDRVDSQIADSSERLECRRSFFGDTSVKLVAVVGTIRPSKDHLLALRVCQELLTLDSTWRFLFIGDALGSGGGYRSKGEDEANSYKSEVFAAVNNLGLKDFVAFAGQRNDVIGLISSSDVLLSTSRHEGFPNVVLEAMAARVPVVSTCYSDIQMILPESWQVVSDRSPVKLASAVLRAFLESGSIVLKQRSFVEENATVDKSAGAMLDTFACYLKRKA